MQLSYILFVPRSSENQILRGTALLGKDNYVLVEILARPVGLCCIHTVDILAKSHPYHQHWEGGKNRGDSYLSPYFTGGIFYLFGFCQYFSCDLFSIEDGKRSREVWLRIVAGSLGLQIQCLWRFTNQFIALSDQFWSIFNLEIPSQRSSEIRLP